jgi:MOSC domain-containing protein YiiM
MREVSIARSAPASIEAASFLACVATIVELSFDDLPVPPAGEDPATGGTVTRWLGGLGIGLAPIAQQGGFAWPGPWIARIKPPAPADSRFVVMYGVPSGVVWDPGGAGEVPLGWIEDGFLVAAADIALALPPRPEAPAVQGMVEAICVARSAGNGVETLPAVTAIAGRGLEGDRYLIGDGTFPSGPPGSALTMIGAEVCESFDPPLSPDEHRRNVVTRGIDVNALLGHEFMLGEARCRGMRLCEPCTVVDRYAARPVLRALVHRGGLRADILAGGVIMVGDEVSAIGSRPRV